MKREIRERQHIPLKDLDTVAAADVVCDLRRVAFVVHEEKVNFPNIADQELLQAIGKKVAGLEKRVMGQPKCNEAQYSPSCCFRNQSV